MDNKTILLTAICNKAFANGMNIKTYPIEVNEEEKLFIQLTKGCNSITHIYDMVDLLYRNDIQTVINELETEIENKLL